MTIPDTNVSLQYSVNLKFGILSLSLLQSEEITSYLDSVLVQRKLLITETVFTETMKNIWNTATEAGTAAGIKSAYTIRAVAHEAILRFVDLSKGRLLADDTTKLPLVAQMYDQIWADPSKDAKKSRWAVIKKTTVEQGPPKGDDLVILSTAAKHQDAARTEILTCDHDFLLFDDEIRQVFSVEIRSAYRLPRVTRRKR